MKIIMSCSVMALSAGSFSVTLAKPGTLIRLNFASFKVASDLLLYRLLK